MSNQFKNMLIGVFLVGALGVIVSLVMFLRPSVGNERQTLYVRFSNINKINVGTRVLFAGKAVGEVTQITQIYHARETQPSDSLGRLFFYQLTLKVDSNVVVYNTDEISIQTSGLLGEKSIAIIPKAPPKGVIAERLTDKVPFYADSIDPIENTFNRLSDIGQKLEDTVDLVKTWIAKNSDNLSHAVTAFGSAMDQFDCVGRQINEEQVVAQIKQGAEKFTASMAQVDDALTQMHQDGVFSNMGGVVANLKRGTANFDRITQDIADGRGTIGKLVAEDDMYLRMTAILSKADTMMNDINHYGVLFHLNKSWQRMRTKRMTVLNALDTPSGFKDYFQKEMDQINTAMARISMLIAKAATQPTKGKVAETPKFRQDFAELLRQVDEMSDNLKLYNEQLMQEAQ
jgi:phospholipid/cholesterol/gamma-HCH transport system substrate-binding protein